MVNTTQSDDLADSLRGQQQDNSEMMRSMSQAFQGQPQPMQDPRMGDIMNPHANKYRQQY